MFNTTTMNLPDINNPHINKAIVVNNFNIKKHNSKKYTNYLQIQRKERLLKRKKEYLQNQKK